MYYDINARVELYKHKKQIKHKVFGLWKFPPPPCVAPTINTLTVNTDLDNTAVRTIALGEPIILACEADDSVTFSWFRNGEELTQSSDSVVITNMVGTTSMLEISSFQESGVYQCRVETTTGYHAVDNIALGATGGCQLEALSIRLFFLSTAVKSFLAYEGLHG